MTPIGDKETQEVKGTWAPPPIPGSVPPGDVPEGFEDLVPPEARVGLRDFDAQNREPDEEVVDLTPSAFPDKWKKDFEGLLYLGELEDEVEIPYHRFVIRTLKPSDKIEIVKICQPYEGSLGFNKVYRPAVVAAALISVDGKQIVVADKKVSILRQKFQYVIDSWYEPIIDLLYERVDQLEGRSLKVMSELGILRLPEELVPLFEDEAVNDAPEGEGSGDSA